MLRKPRRLIQFLLVLVFVSGLLVGAGHAVQPAARELPAAVSLDEQVRVAAAQSGQSLEVSSAASPLAESVRLLGIDAPDRQQNPWGSEATEHLSQWLKGQTVRLEFDQNPRDAYGRKAAYVWLGDRLINKEMVAEGWALAQASRAFVSPDRSTRYDLQLMAAQEKARLLGRGIWNLDTPMHQTPAEFRQQEDL